MGRRTKVSTKLTDELASQIASSPELRETATKKPVGTLLTRRFPNHQKLLICDDKFAVCGSFNWLSNAGRSPNQERSWIVTNKEFIQQEWELILHELGRLYSRKRLFGRES